MKPKAILSVQRTDDEAGLNATVFEHPTKVYFEGTVEYEIGEGGSVGILVLDIYNVTVSDLVHLHPNGVVKLDAGYEDAGTGDRSAPVSTIFYGFLDHAYAYRAGGEPVIRLAAVTVPTKMGSSRIPFSTPHDQSIPAIEYGRRIMKFIGGSVTGSRASREVDMPPGYTATGTLMEELEFVRQHVSDTSGHEHTLVPSVAGNPLDMRLIDMTEGEGSGVEKLIIDLDKDFVTSANFQVSRKDVEPVGGVSEQGTDAIAPETEDTTTEFLDTVNDKSLSVEFNISMAFDPRVVIGMFIRATGEVEGIVEMTAVSVRHKIGQDWETTVGGPANGGNVIGSGDRIAA